MFATVRNLLSNLIDYAGLFPPASLDMDTAVSNFERYRSEAFAWALGRFVVPASRLGELKKNFAGPLSVLVGADMHRDMAATRAFVLGRPEAIEIIEVKADTVEKVREISRAAAGGIPTFIEIPLTDSCATLLSVISEEACCAKVRTGGITPEAFPTASELVRFLQLCSSAGVPFKATAGLHHPIRGSHRLTYDADSPSAVMHGFLNVFLAAGFIRNQLPTELVTELVEEQSAAAFQFNDDSIAWRNNRLTKDEIAAVRDNFAVSFGSCSFEEPIEDLRSMGLL